MSSRAQETENLLESSKSWYLENQAQQIVKINGRNENNDMIIKKELWDKAKVYTIDGVDVVGVPMAVSLPNGKDVKGDFMLFIKKAGDEFTSLVISNREKDYFSGTFTDAEIKKIHDDALALIELHKRPVGKATGGRGSNKVMLLPGETGPCTDWYWTVYALDEAGNILYIIGETYLYTTCPDDDMGPGDLPPDEEEPTIMWGDAISDHDFVTSSDIEMEDLTLGKAVDIGWWFYDAQAVGIKFRSLERAKISTFYNANWTFHSFNHIGTVAVGNTSGTSVPNVLSVEHVDVDAYNLMHGIKLTFQEIRTYLYKGKSRTDNGPILFSKRKWTAKELSGE